MKRGRFRSVLLIGIALAAVAAPPVRALADGEDNAAPLFRIFLKDGTALVSYGELARVDDRVVFSMPTSASAANPELQLVTIGSDTVDWVRTNNYAEAARATRYIATRAENDYTTLTTEIAQALNDIALTADPATRLAILEKARKALADWPASHFAYKTDDIRQMLGVLDEAIADLRAAAGLGQFNLAFVAAPAAPAPSERLLPPPTPKEAIEQTLAAARLTTSPAERTSLLAVALHALDRDTAALPAEWAVTARIDTKAALAREIAIDDSYRILGVRIRSVAAARARAADVRGVERLLDDITDRDAALGRARPETVDALVDAVKDQLDAARRLRLQRDRWALRLPVLQRYREAMAGLLSRLAALQPSLEDIKSLAGSAPAALDTLQHSAQLISRSAALVDPPDELRDAHALLASAAQLAGSAATIRREATLAGDIARAWDASSAAAGALMLSARAQKEIQSVFRFPQLPQ